MNSPAVSVAMGQYIVPGTDQPLSSAHIPIVAGERLLGSLVLKNHQRENAFGEAEVRLLTTIAASMGVALENARLHGETQEALERQTATAEILKVIAGSSSDVQPVFDAIARSANRLIGGFSTAVARVRDGHLHLVAFTATDASGEDALKKAFPYPASQSKAVRTRAPVCIVDAQALPDAASAVREVARARGWRSVVYVPMLREGVAIGVITVTRRVAGDFSSHQIGLLETFADQAVIAIENVRLFNETQEALERQTATANVLKAISRTTFDLKAVLEVLIATAARLCGASLGVIFRVDGDLCLASGLFGATPALIEHLAAHPPRLSLRDGITAEAAATGHPVQVEDAATDTRYGRPDVQRVGGYRTLLAVPILREAEAIGVLTLGRAEARAFDAKEIELVASFATRRRSRWRTCACSTRRRRRCSNRRPRPRCCRSSAARSPTRSRCSTRSSTAASTCSAATNSTCCSSTNRACCRSRPTSARRATSSPPPSRRRWI